MKWENAYVFISSTFNDMHAERSLLVKRVFPDLRMWCQERKIKLIDIDLRWGVSEEDASENKKVVDICLKNIDKCRPFFLCFLGQRRGWVPMQTDIHPDTMHNFPGLKKYIGNQSITELEIIHALLDPLKDNEVKIPTPLFYFRKPDYLSQITNKNIHDLYASSWKDIHALKKFKNKITKEYSAYEYDAIWDNSLLSPELEGLGETNLTCGRLSQFTIGETAMAQHILEHLKEAISKEFPDNIPNSVELTALEKELEWQDSYLNSLEESYIRRPEEEERLLNYIYGQENRPYILEADAGTGKTSLLAHLLTQIPEKQRFYRFIGTSQESSDIHTMLDLLYKEFHQAGLLSKEEVIEAKGDCLINFQNILTKISAKHKKTESASPFILVLDAIDQFRFSEELPYWIPTLLPDNIRLIISLKTDTNAQRNLYLHQGNYLVSSLHKMTDEKDKRRMIEEYMGQYLKTVDEKQIKLLLSMKGSSNPLYLKIILNELRIHGSFETLQKKLTNNYGSSPSEAFLCVLERLEKENFLEIEHKNALVILFLTMMAYSLEGLDIPYTASLLTKGVKEFQGMKSVQLSDSMYVIAKHLSPYLVIQGRRVDFLYESFRIAVKKRYHQYEKMAHKLLSVFYRVLLNINAKTLRYNKGKASDMVSLAHHTTNCSIEDANTELLSPWFLYEYCKRLGAGALAKQYYIAAKLSDKGYLYEQIANALISVQAKVSVHPCVVFYELKKILGDSHPLFNSLLEKTNEMSGQFFYQTNPHEKCLHPQKEITKYKKDVVHTFLHSDFVSYKLRDAEIDDMSMDTFVIQNISDGKIEKVIQIPEYTVVVDSHEDYIYTRYRHPELRYVIYEIPSMKKVIEGNYPDCPDGFRWHSSIHGYKDYVFGGCSNKSKVQKVINLRTGQTVWEYTPEDSDEFCYTLFYGKLLFAYTIDVFLTLVDLTTGKVLLKYEGKYHSKFTSDETNGYLLCMKDHIPMWHYIHYEDDEIIVEDAKEMKPYLIGNSYAVINGCLCSFKKDKMYVFDNKMNYLGYQTFPEDMRELDESLPTLHRRGNYVIYNSNISLKFYSADKLLNSLKKETVTTRQLGKHLIHNNYLYLFYSNGEIEKKEPVSNKVIKSCKDISVTYNKKTLFKCYGSYWIIGIHHGWYGDDYRQYQICMKNMRDLSTGIRYTGTSPEGMSLQEAFYLDGKTGLIFGGSYNLIEQKTLFAPNGTESSYNMRKFSIMLTSDFQNFEEWEPGFEYASSVELFSYQDELYLMFDGIYIDDYHIGIKIYHIRSRKCVCELILTADYKIYTTQMAIADECLCISIWRFDYTEKKHHKYLYFLNYLTGDVHFTEYPTGVDVDGCCGDEVFVTSIDSDCTRREIMIISAKTGEIKNRIPSSPVRSMDTKIIKKYGGYLVHYENGTLDVYTDDSNGPVFSQALVPGELTDWPGTNKFIITSNDNHYYIYTLGSIPDLLNNKIP